MWGGPAGDDEVDALIDLGRDDWTDIAFLASAVIKRLGAERSLADYATALGELVGVLIDHDIVPGDLGADPDFQPWPGTKTERVERVVREVLELGELPWSAQIAWFYHAPPDQPAYPHPPSAAVT